MEFGLKGTSRLVADVTGSRHSGLGFTVFWLFTAKMHAVCSSYHPTNSSKYTEYGSVPDCIVTMLSWWARNTVTADVFQAGCPCCHQTNCIRMVMTSDEHITSISLCLCSFVSSLLCVCLWAVVSLLPFLSIYARKVYAYWTRFNFEAALKPDYANVCN